MYTDEQLIMISAIQHMAFCERQCALIHLEQVWADNHLTIQGEVMHEKVHTEERENRKDVRITRSLRLVSYKYGITGQSDVVEFHKSNNGIILPKANGLWIPFPVEYKRGKPKKDNIDEVQLCAQALCLEEMLNTNILNGALFYGEQKRRTDVAFDEKLRQETIKFINLIHKMFTDRQTPKAILKPKCKNCSLYDICNPKFSELIQQKRYNQLLFGGDDEKTS